MEDYFGTYHIFQVYSKDDAAQLMSADNLIGDLYDIQIELNEGKHEAWLVNRFNQRTGCFDPCFSRKLSILNANGLTLKASLSLVGYTERSPEAKKSEQKENAGNSKDEDSATERNESGYWGEAAVFGFKETHRESFDPFMRNVSDKLKEGIRPRIDLGDEGFRQVVSSRGSWTPDQKEPKPRQQRGTVVMKDHLTLSDKVVEQGRQGNKGCYLISWIFIVGIALGGLVLLKSLL